MIADAVDTLITLSWALLAWIVLCAVFATLALYAVVTAVAVPVGAARRAVAGALAASAALRALGEQPGSPIASEGRVGPSSARVPPGGAPTTGPSRTTVPRWRASQGLGGGFPVPDPERPAEARTAPSWARTDKEAA